MAAHQSGGDHRGQIKDPGHDGRLKENREAGRIKSTTPGSAAHAHEHGHEPAGPQFGGSDDLKSRDYKDAGGNVHHRTKTYREQHANG